MQVDYFVQELVSKGWSLGKIRPIDQELVVYFFEPFMGLYVGRYDKETDSVAGISGFTSWQPEVLCWYGLPG